MQDIDGIVISRGGVEVRRRLVWVSASTVERAETLTGFSSRGLALILSEIEVQIGLSLKLAMFSNEFRGYGYGY